MGQTTKFDRKSDGYLAMLVNGWEPLNIENPHSVSALVDIMKAHTHYGALKFVYKDEGGYSFFMINDVQSADLIQKIAPENIVGFYVPPAK